MVAVKAVSSDEIFQEWVSKANINTLKKFYERKKVEFKRDHVSAVESVYNVSKFIVIYFEKKIPETFSTSTETKIEKTTVDGLEKYKFYDFKNKRVDYDQWKEKITSVPSLSSLQSSDCPKCNGFGKTKCETCGGSVTIKCDKCEGNGKIACGTCKGTKTLTTTIDVYDAENKKTKTDIRIPCPYCSHTGTITCTKCNGARIIYCRNCNGGANTCKVCKGYGVLYSFKYEPVPFIMTKKRAMVFYKKDVEKFIDKKEVEQLLNAQEIEGIAIYNPDELNQTKLLPELNYWTPEADKICSEAKKVYKDLMKSNQIRANQKIMVFPALQLRCKSVKGKNFEIFGVGTSGSFVVLDDGFQ
ncbi:MAG: hypothetical protein JXA54_12310 [Candidatus Heimdallarchaeota archaeon]|nr:hypothetical protein [Candidatus Heimdallarchaeota archaeon]